jgi:hypothetical protein
MKRFAFSRRTMLRGAGVALALPFFESLDTIVAPRIARAQAAPRTRYIALYFPNGTAQFFRPRGEGGGDAWQLSPILEPFAALKSQLSVLSNVANYSPFGGHVEPSHSNLGAATWTCVKPSGDGNQESGISVDQVIANALDGQTALSSLQVGLSTLDSYEDGLPGQHSRSISWKSASEPLYKLVNPQAVFDRITAGGIETNTGDDAALMRRRALKQSVLDYVRDSALSVQKKLGASDRQKLDQYLTSVRALERRVADSSMQVGASCQPIARPEATYSIGNVPGDYDRGAHATLMIDLVVMALQCDLTRVVSFMLDDARSDFVYDFITEREFTDDGSTPTDRRVGGYHGLQHAGDRNNGFATIGYWNAERAAELAGKLAAIDEGDGSNVLDNTVITFGSGMNGGNHDAGKLPLALIGGGGGKLKRDQHFAFGSEQRLADLHLTILRQVFGIEMGAFGASEGIIEDLLV